MNNPRLAARYAKSILDLAQEKDALETMHTDVLLLQQICKQSREFTAMLRSPIIKADKKKQIISAVVAGKVSPMMKAFLDLLVSKGREASLPEILDAFVKSYDKIKGINHIRLTTAAPVSDALKQEIVGKIAADTGLTNIQLHEEVNPDLVGGFVLQYENALVDSSVRRYLKDLKRQYARNDYIMSIR